MGPAESGPAARGSASPALVRRSVAVVLAALGLVALVGCEGGGSSADDDSAALAARVGDVLRSDGAASVVDRLEQLGVAVDEAALAAADVTCPRVPDPSTGDGATCRATVDGIEVALEVEFTDDDGAFQLVGVELVP